MKSRKRKNRVNYKRVPFYVVEQDLSGEQSVDSVAMSVMECLEVRVSEELYDLLKEMLLGFNENMQLEIADALMDFVYGHMIHTTGCLAADAVLDACYLWIAEEKGIEIVRR